jgi:hypothetical protein
MPSYTIPRGSTCAFISISLLDNAPSKTPAALASNVALMLTYGGHHAAGVQLLTTQTKLPSFPQE